MRMLTMLALLGATGAATAQVSPRDLLQVADFGAPVISPDGRQVAFRVERAAIERNTYDAAWYVQPMDGSAPPRWVADGGVVLRDSAGNPLPARAAWSPDGHWIYYRARLGDVLAVWRAAADGGDARPVTQDAADVRDFALDADGRTLSYSVGATREAVVDAEQAEYAVGVHVDGAVPVGQGLFRSGNVEGRLATQRYAKTWFDRISLLGDMPDQWKAVDLATGQLRVEAPGEASVSAVPAESAPSDTWITARSADGTRAAMLTRFGARHGLRFPPEVRLSAMVPCLGAMTCMHALCTGRAISGVQWRPGRDEVVFTVTDPLAGGAQSLFRWDVQSGVVLPVAQSDGLLAGGRDASSACAVSAEALACVSATAAQPPRLERIDLETGARTVLFAPNAALADAMAHTVDVRLLQWKGANGQQFTGQYYTAKGAPGRRSPLFVNYYRCSGFVRGGVGDEWAFASLAAHGIAALCIDAAPYRVDPVARYEDARAAVEGAVSLLGGRGEIDAARVGMGGLSFGSEVTLWMAMQTKLLAAASVSSPSVSSTYYLFGSLKGPVFADGLKQLWGLGTLRDTPARWKQLSPEFGVARISAPILFQMSEQEYLPALDYAVDLINTGRGDLYVFPNEPHVKFQPQHKLAVYERNIDWFRYWLLGEIDRDPAKEKQYAHWRTLRGRDGPDPKAP